MTFDWGLVAEHLPEVATAATVTLGAWAATSLTGAVGGFLIAFAWRYGPRPLAIVLRAAVEVLRGTPFLVQLFLLYYGGPFIGLSLDAIPAGILALTIYASAYYAEIFRAGFEAVPAGHVEAALCAGFTRPQVLRRIVVPEMTILILPALVNMAILMLKETAVLSIISVPELTLTINAIGTQTFAFVESLSILAVAYWALTEGCAWLGRAAEHRLGRFGFAGP